MESTHRFPQSLEIALRFPHSHRQCFYSVAASVFAFLACSTQLEDDAVVHQAINGRGGCHRIFEDASHLENGRLLEIKTLPRS